MGDKNKSRNKQPLQYLVYLAVCTLLTLRFSVYTGKSEQQQSYVPPLFTPNLTTSLDQLTGYHNKLCAWRHDMPPPLSSPVGAQGPRAPPSRRNVRPIPSHDHRCICLTR